MQTYEIIFTMSLVTLILYVWIMGRLKLYDISNPPQTIVAERESLYLSRTAEQRFSSVLQLNYISVIMNGGNPLKLPQEKGIVIRKLNS